MARAHCVPRVAQPLPCDFHIHSTFSDGRLSLAELVDLPGRRGFNVLCVTDHAADLGHRLGRWGERLQFALDPRKLAAYFWGPGTLLRAPIPRGECAPPVSTAAVASLTETVLAEPAPDLVAAA